jgi:hypothetical protein
MSDGVDQSSLLSIASATLYANVSLCERASGVMGDPIQPVLATLLPNVQPILDCAYPIPASRPAGQIGMPSAIAWRKIRSFSGVRARRPLRNVTANNLPMSCHLYVEV